MQECTGNVSYDTSYTPEIQNFVKVTAVCEKNPYK